MTVVTLYASESCIVCVQVYDPNHPGFPPSGVPTIQTTLPLSKDKNGVTNNLARYYVAIIATSAEV